MGVEMMWSKALDAQYNLAAEYMSRKLIAQLRDFHFVYISLMVLLSKLINDESEFYNFLRKNLFIISVNF